MKEITFKSTVDVDLIEKMGGDYMVVAAAKVSTNGTLAKSFANGTAVNDKGEQWGEKDTAGLINYLIKHRHGTPFEHSTLCFFVHAPIFVWREWHRHRIGFSYNEESARYKQLDPVFYLPDRERPMMKVEGWRPGRPKFLRCESDDVYNNLITNLKHAYSVGYEMYEANLALNIDPGLARDCLNFGIFSGCWVTCNPRSLMAFLSLRHHDPDSKFVSYPLWEIDLAAQVAEKFLAEGWPITHQAFLANGRVAP